MPSRTFLGQVGEESRLTTQCVMDVRVHTDLPAEDQVTSPTDAQPLFPFATIDEFLRDWRPPHVAKMEQHIMSKLKNALRTSGRLHGLVLLRDHELRYLMDMLAWE